jgi:(p)ppGpp synthase/HD superfamily hydrolase
MHTVINQYGCKGKNLLDLDKIAAFAAEKHAGQFRWDGQPYYTHPFGVAKLLNSPIEKAIGLLSHVLEDTDATEAEILEICGSDMTAKDVLRAVKALTRGPEPYAEYIARIMGASGTVKAVKLADLEHNLSDLSSGKQRDKYELAKLAILCSVKRSLSIPPY